MATSAGVEQDDQSTARSSASLAKTSFDEILAVRLRRFSTIFLKMPGTPVYYEELLVRYSCTGTGGV